MLTEPLNHQAMALPINQNTGHATEARVARRNRRACSGAGVHGAIKVLTGRRLQAHGRELLHAALELDQARVVQRQAAAQFRCSMMVCSLVLSTLPSAPMASRSFSGPLVRSCPARSKSRRWQSRRQRRSGPGSHKTAGRPHRARQSCRVDLAVDLATAIRDRKYEPQAVSWLNSDGHEHRR
jgi:hypothetical protein